MIIKKKLILLILIFALLLITGCWDRKELNDIGIVLALALDKDRDSGGVIMSCQIVRPAALKKDGAGKESPVEIIMTRGNTILEAMRNVSEEFDRRAYFPHNKVIIISEELAKEGVKKILDVFMRSGEMRRLSWFVIARGVKASEILGIKHGIEDVQATYLENIIKRRKVKSEVVAVSLLEFIKKTLTDRVEPIAGVMQFTEEPSFPIEQKEGTSATIKGIKLAGAAVFKGDKLLGFLDNYQTKGLNWLIDKIDSSVYNVPSPGRSGDLIAVEVFNARTAITPEFESDSIIFKIRISSEGTLLEQQGDIDSSKPAVITEIEKNLEEIIKKEVENTINIVQEKYKSDIFGFGGLFNQKYPQEWQEIKNNWSQLFPQVECSVKVKTEIRRTGLLLESMDISK